MKKLLYLVVTLCILVNTSCAYTYHRIVINNNLAPSNYVSYKENNLYFISENTLESYLNAKVWESDGIIYISKKPRLITIKDNQISVNWISINKSVITRVINNKLFFNYDILNYLGYIVTFNPQYEFVYLTTPNEVYNSSIEKFIEINKGLLLDSLSHKSSLINIDGVYPPTSSDKIAYLTFDDGPSSKITTKILDILKQYDVKATFFMQGEYAKNHSNIVERVHQEGHSIGNHSFTHKRSIYNSENIFKDELEHTNQVIKDITGTTPKYFRPPYGDKLTSGQFKTIDNLGLKYTKWNVDSGDSHGKNVSKTRIYNNIIKSIGKSKNVIILMHDNDGHSENIYILKDIIKALWQKGYTLKAL